MIVVERCVETYYEPEGYDDVSIGSGQVPPLLWCGTMDAFSGSTFASFQKFIDALF